VLIDGVDCLLIYAPANSVSSAAIEASVVDQLQKLRSKADNTASAAGNRAVIQNKLLTIQVRVFRVPSD
jgi:hypothetical protein